MIPLKTRQQLIRKALNESLDLIITNSNYSFQRNILFGIHKEKMCIVRGGVANRSANIRFFKSIVQKQIRRKLKLNKEILLVIACRFKKFKGIDLFLNELGNSEYKTNFYLIFIGEGEEETIYRQLLEKYNIQHRFLGKLPNNIVLKYIAGSNFLINTSIEEKRKSGDETYIHTETMGRSIIEAISVGTPVIASKVGGIPEFQKENINTGIYINDFDELQEFFPKLINWNKKMSVIDYSWKKIFFEYNFLMKKLLKEGVQ